MDAAKTFCGAPGGDSLIRVAVISSGDRGAYVPGGNQALVNVALLSSDHTVQSAEPIFPQGSPCTPQTLSP